MKMKTSERKKYDSDDYNRYAGPEYLDRVSLSNAYGHYVAPGQGKGPKGYRRADALIYEDVCEALLNDPMIDPSDIDVEVKDGVVSFRGAVENRQMKREVEISIEHISEVVDVFNLLNLYQFREAVGEGLIKNQARLEP
jgi:hypothetical protein